MQITLHRSLPGRILVILLVITMQSFAQVPQTDVVYLKSGSFLKGTIVEMQTEKYLKLLLATGDTMAIQMSEVDSVKKESGEGLQRKGYEGKVKAWGYTIIPELGLGVGLLEGLERYSDPAEVIYSLMLSVFNGFTLSPHIQLGVGLGLNFWKQRAFIPLYLDLRTNILKKVNTPFFFANVGYSFGWMNGQKGQNTGGATAGIGAGVKYGVGKKQVMTVSLGYLFQQTRYFHFVNNVESIATVDGHLANLKVGFVF